MSEPDLSARYRTAFVTGASTGRFLQAGFGPFLARFGSLALKRKIQGKYFGL